MSNKAILITIGVLVVLNIVGWWLFYKERTKPVETITKIERRVDTIKLRDPVPAYTTLKSYQFFDFPIEKVIYVDSSSNVQVEIPIEQKTYRDSNYMAIVSGFNPKLDYIETYNNTTTVTTTNVVKQRPIVSFGIGASAIWNPVTHQFDWGIGGSVIIPLWSWYH